MPRTARFFVPPEWVAKNAKAFSIPAGPTYRQIVTVLRLKTGAEVSLFTGDGHEYEGVIIDIAKPAITGEIRSVTKPSAIAPAITVCAAVTKGDGYEWMLQKCTELGVQTFIPVISDRVIKRPKDIPRRWPVIVTEACEQSGRTTLPDIREPMTLKEALQATKNMATLLLHESGTPGSWPKMHATTPIAIFVGPEGGFTEDEVLLAQDLEAHIITLPPPVLRAETAAVSAVATLRYR